MERFGGWYWYLTKQAKLLEKHKCGKWMYFFTDQKFALRICERRLQRMLVMNVNVQIWS